VVEAAGVEEAQRKLAEGEVESQLRQEQGKLADLQSMLDWLDRALDESARAKK